MNKEIKKVTIEFKDGKDGFEIYDVKRISVVDGIGICINYNQVGKEVDYYISKDVFGSMVVYYE